MCVLTLFAGLVGTVVFMVVVVVVGLVVATNDEIAVIKESIFKSNHSHTLEMIREGVGGYLSY